METTTLRRAFALLLSAVMLAGLLVVAAVPVGADDDDDEPAVNIDAFAGLGANDGDGDTSDPGQTGDLNDPLAGGSNGTPGVADADATSGSDPGTTEGSNQTDPAAYSVDPKYKLMLDLIISDVHAYEAEAKKAGRTLTEADRAAVATRAVKDLITILQEAGLLPEVDKRELLKQIEGIPTEPQDPSSQSKETEDD